MEELKKNIQLYDKLTFGLHKLRLDVCKSECRAQELINEIAKRPLSKIKMLVKLHNNKIDCDIPCIHDPHGWNLTDIKQLYIENNVTFCLTDDDTIYLLSSLRKSDIIKVLLCIGKL